MQSALQVLSFSTEECETIYKILASILHLGNIYFHRKQLKHGYEGVEIGSEVEIKWAAHLLQLSVTGIKKARLYTHIRLLKDVSSKCTFYKNSLSRNWILQSTTSSSYRRVPEGHESCNCMTSALQNQFRDNDFL